MKGEAKDCCDSRCKGQGCCDMHMSEESKEGLVIASMVMEQDLISAMATICLCIDLVAEKNELDAKFVGQGIFEAICFAQ